MTQAIFRVCLGAAFIIALSACGGGGGDSSTNLIAVPPEPPQDGITGRAASGISGAQLTVHDATGEEIVIASGRTTNENGAYDLVFSEFAIESGIEAPLVITLDGEGATAVCDYDRDGDNDCLTADGSFTAFGTTYDLPRGFQLRAMAHSFPTRTEATTGDISVNVNLTAASDLATRYALESAGGNNLTSEEVILATEQSLGIVEFTTGLSTMGRELDNIAVIDLTETEIPSTDRLALALFGSSLHGQVNTDDAGIANYRLVLNRMGNRIRPNGNGQFLNASGSFMSEVVSTYVSTATAYQSLLNSPSPVLAGSIAAQTVAQPLLAQSGGNAINIALPADPNSDEPLDRTKVFVANLSEVIGASLLISDTAGFGGTANGAATVYSEQLSLIGTLVSQEVRNTLLQLDQAITTALDNGETELTGTNVSGVLELTDNVVTMTVATSTTSNIQTGISVNITISSGTRSNPGGTGTLDSSEITITVSQTQNDLTTQELFEGTIALGLTGTDTDSVSFTGNLRSTTNRTFSGDISVNTLGPISESQEQGNYQAGFTFTSGASLSLTGQLQNQINTLSLTSGNSSIVSDLITNTITDMNSALNLSVSSQGDVTGGTLSHDGGDTGSMDANGIITFADDTTVALPAPVI